MKVRQIHFLCAYFLGQNVIELIFWAKDGPFCLFLDTLGTLFFLAKRAVFFIDWKTKLA